MLRSLFYLAILILLNACMAHNGVLESPTYANEQHLLGHSFQGEETTTDAFHFIQFSPPKAKIKTLAGTSVHIKNKVQQPSINKQNNKVTITTSDVSNIQVSGSKTAVTVQKAKELSLETTGVTEISLTTTNFTQNVNNAVAVIETPQTTITIISHAPTEISQGGYFREYRLSYNQPDNAGFAQAYLQKGIALTRTACFQVLDSFASKNNDSQFSQRQVGILILLASGILGINDANSEGFTQLALAGAAIDSSFNLYRNHYLLGPDGDVIVDNTKKAMEAVFNDINKNPPISFLDAFTKLQSYAQGCTNATINRLVRESLQKANIVAEAPLINQNSEIFRQKIASAYGRTHLDNVDLSNIWIILFKDPINKTLKTEIGKSLEEKGIRYDTVRDEAIDGDKKGIKNYFNQLPLELIARFENRYTELLAKAKEEEEKFRAAAQTGSNLPENASDNATESRESQAIRDILKKPIGNPNLIPKNQGFIRATVR